MSTLYLVATPIGNLGDITVRALDTLRECDFIAAEDTRVSLKLLNHFEIKKPLVSYHEHNCREMGPKILARIQSGESCALVTDAGMPAISDPGRDLVALCHDAGVPVRVIPGASAVVSAVALSGLDGARFCFEGFLPSTSKERRDRLSALATETRASVVYEAPHRLQKTLSDLSDALGGTRRIAVCRELTKLHEETFVTTLADAAAKYEADPPKGEFALVIEGAAATSDELSPDDAIAAARRFIEQGMSASEAAKRAASMSSLSKGEIYRALIDR